MSRDLNLERVACFWNPVHTSLYYPPSTSCDSHLLQMRPCCTICLPLFCMNLHYWVKIPSQKTFPTVQVDGIKNVAWEYTFAAAQCAFFKSWSPAAACLPHRGWSCVLQLKVVVMGTRLACRGGLMCVFQHKSWALRQGVSNRWIWNHGGSSGLIEKWRSVCWWWCQSPAPSFLLWFCVLELELIHFTPLVIYPANYLTVSVVPSLPTPDPAPRHRPAFLLHLVSFSTTTLTVQVNLDEH